MMATLRARRRGVTKARRSMLIGRGGETGGSCRHQCQRFNCRNLASSETNATGTLGTCLLILIGFEVLKEAKLLLYMLGLVWVTWGDRANGKKISDSILKMASKIFHYSLSILATELPVVMKMSPEINTQEQNQGSPDVAACYEGNT
jgi:hypothetical protein